MPAATPAAKSASQNKRTERSDPSSKKRRWSAAERAAKGRKPRRRGGIDTEKSLDRSTRRGDVRRGFERPADVRETTDRRDSGRDFNRSQRPDRGAVDRTDRRWSDSRRTERPGDRASDRPADRFGDRRGPRRDDRGTDRGGEWAGDRQGPRRDDRASDRGGERAGDRRGPRRDDRGTDRGGEWAGDRRGPRRDDRASDRGGEWAGDRRGPRRDDRATDRAADRSGDRRGPRRDDRAAGRSADRYRADERYRAEPLVSDVPAAVQLPTELEHPDINVGFADLGVAPELVDRLAADGILSPFPIQAASIPDGVSGRDVLGRGRTGSGKTLGFGLPMLTRLAGQPAGGKRRRDPRGLILLPTRELATQVSDVLGPLARTVGLRTVLVAGGMSYGPQLKALDSGVDVVIGTPGRLIDLMERGDLLLDSVQVTVLDEADHMADLGFLPEVTTLLDAVPADGQRMLFSATLDRGVDRLVQTYLHDPSTHSTDTAQASVETMTHYLMPVAPADKRPLTAEIANRDGRTVIFVRTQLGADRVAEQLRESGVMAGALHGGLPQGARTRTLEAFKSGSLPVLVATDVAARGIHVDEVGLVLQVDPPADSKTYLHRAGRTARAGEAGVVVTLVLPNQRHQVRRLAEDAGVRATQLAGRPGDAELAAATGAAPATAAPITGREYESLIAPRFDRGSKRRPGGPGRGPRRDRGGPGGTWDAGRSGGKEQRRAAYHSGR